MTLQFTDTLMATCSVLCCKNIINSDTDVAARWCYVASVYIYICCFI